MTPLRTFALGAPGETTWLAGWFPDSHGVLLVGAENTVAAREAELEADGAWRVRAADAQLTITAASGEAVVSGLDGVLDGFEQAASGEGTVDGAPVAATGRRGERGALNDVDSVRDVAAWFGDGGVVAVTALRPRKAKGHEQDAVRAAVVDSEGFGPVVDPRLSTIYTGSGRVRRVGMELWSQDEDAPALRLAAEATGRGGVVSGGGWAVGVDWLTAHRRGQDGTGIYLLARPA